MKYSRLIVGMVILISMFIFIGSSPGHESEACFNECGGELPSSEWGYIEVWNDTVFHIGVFLHYDKNAFSTHVIKHDPGMIRKGFLTGKVRVGTYIIDPILKTWKYHRTYTITINTGQTHIVRVKGGSLL